MIIISKNYVYRKSIKLSFIVFLNSKLFTINDVQNVESKHQVNGATKKLSSTIVSIHPLPFNLAEKKLITIIYPQQLVIFILNNSILGGMTRRAMPPGALA